MSLHKGGFLPSASPPPRAAATQWTWNYPNSADFNFNYYNLLGNSQYAIGSLNPNMSVAVIGTGVAGLLAARELYKCGVTKIDIYEASDRIGGRNWSIPAPMPTGNATQATTYEMGAMRMPFFPDPGLGGCVLDYLCSNFSIAMMPFPDPGSTAVKATGIYVNGGYGPLGTYPQPTLDIWPGGAAPPNSTYAGIYDAWAAFKTMFQTAAQPLYGTGSWTPFWQGVVKNYWLTNFRELALMPAISSYNPANPGYFGGLGLTEEQAAILYVIGVGDGGWGAFYDISCLYVFRTILCNFGNDHQLIRGRYVNGNFAPGPQFNTPTKDTKGTAMTPPTYLGLQSVAECLFYMPVQIAGGTKPSLYDCIQVDSPTPMQFFIQTPVTSIKYSGTTAQVVSPVFPTGVAYDVILSTPTTWALEMSPSATAPGQTFFNGFSFNQMPIEVTTAIKESHQITSSKVFWPLKEQFWSNGSGIPQVINTDSFIQDVYGIAANATDPGVLLVSYTWEDDAVKLESDDDLTLANRCLNELDRILLQTLGTTVSQYVNVAAGPTVIHWEQQPTYRGCAKLYREGSFDMDYSLLTWNQNLAANSSLYFAGEGYGVEGGWTEPALRMALDAVINIINDNGGSFTVNGFSYSTYPQWPAFTPSEQTAQRRIKAAAAAAKAPGYKAAGGEPAKIP